MKQYIISKPIKWGFKFWFCFSSKSGYLYQMGIYLGRKQPPEFNLGLREEVALQLTWSNRFALFFFFDNFFNSPKLIKKLLPKSIYGIGKVRGNIKQMQIMIDDKQMKRGDFQFLFLGNTMACK